ncbi:recombinase family protein, partial [Nonomuraea longicatena]|uniref:recombinase family protein n=1 Tax=Nonomuraea longicatena TaxID=83682 RepID=UPI0031CF3BE1
SARTLQGGLRAGIYARISDDREGRELGVTRQLDDGHALAIRITATVVDTYIDNDISASTRSQKVRPDFQRLIADIESGRINAIIYYSTSRLTRRPLENELIIQLVERYGLRLFTVTVGEVDLTTANGRMLARMLAAKDANEAEETAERVTRAQRQMREMGRPTGGPPLRGYLNPDPTKGIGYLTHVDHEAQSFIVGALTRILLGATLTTIIKWWNSSGFYTINGKPWVITTATRLLTNPRIAGLVAVYDTETKRHRIEGVGSWPPVVKDRVKWQAVFLKLTANTRKPEDLVRKHLGAGFVRCGICATLHRVTPSDHGTKKRWRYMCDTTRGGCGGTARAKPWLEQVIREYVAERIRAEGDAPEDVPQDPPGSAYDADIATLEIRLAQVRQAATEGVMDIFDASGIMSDLRARIGDMRAQQAKVTIDAQHAAMSGEVALAEWLSDDLDTLGERRAIMARYVKAVMVHPLPKGKW